MRTSISTLCEPRRSGSEPSLPEAATRRSSRSARMRDMARKAPCKPRDLEDHLAIARQILAGASCRQAVMRITGQTNGEANFERLYRNHLNNGPQYLEIVEQRDQRTELATLKSQLGEKES